MRGGHEEEGGESPTLNRQDYTDGSNRVSRIHETLPVPG